MFSYAGPNFVFNQARTLSVGGVKDERGDCDFEETMKRLDDKLALACDDIGVLGCFWWELNLAN